MKNHTDLASGKNGQKKHYDLINLIHSLLILTTKVGFVECVRRTLMRT